MDPDKWSQETVRVQCIHSDEISYPSAIVNLNLDGWERSIKVALVPNVPVDVVLRHDDPSTVTQKSLMVTTRAQERQQLQEEQMKQTLGEVEANPIGVALSVGQQPSLEGSSQSEMESREGNGPATARGPVSEYLHRQEPNPPHTLVDDKMTVAPRGSQAHFSDEVLQATPLQLRDWQQTDPTLQKVRELALSQKWDLGQGRATFFYRGGLIYRRWSPTLGENQDVLSFDQLVLPQQCRQLVLNIAHDVPMAGHLGINNTKGRILKCYYWPGVFK